MQTSELSTRHQANELRDKMLNMTQIQKLKINQTFNWMDKLMDRVDHGIFKLFDKINGREIRT